MPGLLFREAGPLKARVAAGGIVSDFQFETGHMLLSELANTRCNEIEIEYSPAHLSLKDGDAQIVSARGIFKPSATCSIWVPAKEFSVHNRDSALRQTNAETEEGYLAGLGIVSKPSILELSVELRGGAETSILECCTTALANALSSIPPELEVFGCCDAGGQEMIVRFESNVLMLSAIRIMARTLPTSYPFLGEKFDGVHSIMFGKKDVLIALFAALGNNGKAIHFSSDGNSAVIRVQLGGDKEAYVRRVKDWLVPTIDDL
jgi:hypothetical protein